MATIALKDVKFYAYHGFYQEEQIIGGEFVLDIEVEYDIKRATTKDELGETINYETLYLICESEMKKKQKLIETFAQKISDRVSYYFYRIQGVRVVIKKVTPPIQGRVGAAVVELRSGVFSRGGGGGGGGGNRGRR